LNSRYIRDRVWSYIRRLYQGWVADGAVIDSSWSIELMYRLYVEYLVAVSRAGYLNPYDIVEEVFDMADPSETIWMFDSWAREYLKAKYNVPI
jgi:hypothetical protein